MSGKEEGVGWRPTIVNERPRATVVQHCFIYLFPYSYHQIRPSPYTSGQLWCIEKIDFKDIGYFTTPTGLTDISLSDARLDVKQNNCDFNEISTVYTAPSGKKKINRCLISSLRRWERPWSPKWLFSANESQWQPAKFRKLTQSN